VKKSPENLITNSMLRNSIEGGEGERERGGEGGKDEEMKMLVFRSRSKGE